MCYLLQSSLYLVCIFFMIEQFRQKLIIYHLLRFINIYSFRLDLFKHLSLIVPAKFQIIILFIFPITSPPHHCLQSTPPPPQITDIQAIPTNLNVSPLKSTQLRSFVAFVFQDNAFYCVDIGDILLKHYKVKIATVNSVSRNIYIARTKVQFNLKHVNSLLLPIEHHITAAHHDNKIMS